jgi:hypothetical protein
MVLRGGERNSQTPHFENQIWSMDQKQCRGGDALNETKYKLSFIHVHLL